MPARTSELPVPLTGDARDARKKFLVLACAVDRVELVIAWRKPSRPAIPLLGSVTAILSHPWWKVARTALIPFLPRKIRAAALLYRLWKFRQKK